MSVVSSEIWSRFSNVKATCPPHARSPTSEAWGAEASKTRYSNKSSGFVFAEDIQGRALYLSKKVSTRRRGATAARGREEGVETPSLTMGMSKGRNGKRGLTS